MPVKSDASGRRWVQAETEVRGTPEEIWRAIATGPGITSWFVPTTLEEREGGALRMDFGPGMESKAVITRWDPPRSFVAENVDVLGPGAPAVATEWVVEARAGGTCVVRVVHSWFADSGDWDNQYEGVEDGWRAFFRVLREYLEHFSGLPCAPIQLMAFAPEPMLRAWDEMTGRLGVAGAPLGTRVAAAEDAPPLAGRVAHTGGNEHPELIVRLDAPAPGIAHLLAIPMGGQVCMPIRLFLFGAPGAAAAARDLPAWQRWVTALGGGGAEEGSAHAIDSV